MGDEIAFIPYEEAVTLVAAIQEEEDIEEDGHRILTVYSKNNTELCWFDFNEVMEDIGEIKERQARQAAVQDYILHRIPEWVREL